MSKRAILLSALPPFGLLERAGAFEGKLLGAPFLSFFALPRFALLERVLGAGLRALRCLSAVWALGSLLRAV